MPAFNNEMRALLLEILESAFQLPDVVATQQMGVSVSNAVKRDGGVVIVQNQNVEVYSRMIPPLVRALKLCDSVDAEIGDERAPVLISQVEETKHYPIDECCEHFYENNVGWEEMQRTMRERYLEYVLARSPTRVAAAKLLQVGPTYLSKMAGDRKRVPQLPNSKK